MADIKVLVDTKIAGKKVMVFSKSYCPYCKKAKQVLSKHVGQDLAAEDYEVMEIENHPNCDAIQDYLQKLTGARSVPRVFINGKCIGGGDDTQALDQKGQLSIMLK